jgi:CheY-like chemotaxis protein
LERLWLKWRAVILIVDDFQDGAEALCRLLTKLGYPCRWVPNGREALGLVRGHPVEQPLLVVLDDMMPEMNGVEALREIRGDARIAGTMVMFYSAGFDVGHRDEAMTLGAVAWVLKGGTAVEECIKTIASWYEKAGGVRAVTGGGKPWSTKDR